MFDRLHRHGRLIGIGLAAALLNACGGGGASSPETEPFYIEEQEEWSLVWADEFNGSSVDSSNWTFQTGDGSDNGLPGWGNYEAAPTRRLACVRLTSSTSSTVA